MSAGAPVIMRGADRNCDVKIGGRSVEVDVQGVSARGDGSGDLCVSRSLGRFPFLWLIGRCDVVDEADERDE